MQGLLPGLTPPADEKLPREESAFPYPQAGRLHEAIPAAIGDETKCSAFLLGLARRFLRGQELLWIREDQFALEHGEVYAPGLSLFGLDPRALLLVKAPKQMEALWAAEQGLRRANAIVLLEIGQGRALDLTVTRRLALACEANSSTAFLLRGDIVLTPRMPSAAWTRWRISRARSHTSFPDELSPLALRATLLRHRGGHQDSQYFLEWKSDEYTFAIQTMGSDLATPALHRSA